MIDQAVGIGGKHRTKVKLWTELAAALLILVEVSWLAPWYLGVIEISYTAGNLRAFLVLGGNMLAAYLLTRLAENLHLKRSIRQILVVSLFLANMALAARLLLDPTTPDLLIGLIHLDPGPVLVVLAGAWLWWRGISLAQEQISPRVAWGRFWFGIWMLVAYLLLITRVTRIQPTIIPFLIFLGSGLLALIVSRVAYIGQYYGSQRNPFGRSWIASISATVSFSILLAGLFASLLTGQFKPVLAQLSGVLRWLVAGILFLASIPGLILAYVLSPLIEAFQELFQRSTTPTPDTIPNLILTPVAQPGIPEVVEPARLPPWAITLIFWALVLVVTLIILSRARNQIRWSGTQELTDPEALLGKNELWRKLRQAARQQLDETGNRFRKLRSSRAYQAAYIRRIYAELLDFMEVLGKPRPAGITPLEYLPVLQELLPDVYADLDLITQVYVRVRYGELPETEHEINRLTQAWQRVATEGERQKKLVQARKNNRLDDQPSNQIREKNIT